MINQAALFCISDMPVCKTKSSAKSANKIYTKEIAISSNFSGNISFKGKIIDSHVHVGKFGKEFYTQQDLDIFIKSPLRNGDTIEKMIVSNSSCIDTEGILNEIDGHKQLIKIVGNNPKIAAIAVCQPNLTNGKTKFIEKIFKENPGRYVGLKFHPRSMQLAANDKRYDNYMRFANKHKLPCLFHSDRTYDKHYEGGYIGEKCNYSRPEQIYELARRHKNVPVVLGHMGGNEGRNTKAAVDVIVDSIENNSATLYADISWVNCDTAEKPDIIEAIKRLKNTSQGYKTDRLLFGTDAPIGRFGGKGEFGIKPFDAYQKVIVDVKNSIRQAFSPEEADALIEKIFYKNAQDLFFSKKNTSLNLKTKIIASCTTILSAALILICGKKHNKNNRTAV